MKERNAAMSVNVAALGLDQLSVGDRLDLIDQIWNTLPLDVASTDVPEWHLAELKKRREEMAANPTAGAPWRDALNQLGARS
jgi:putative addiction module component (TIGR02574 family)